MSVNQLTVGLSGSHIIYSKNEYFLFLNIYAKYILYYTNLNALTEH
jgi:hypothetical protein